MSDQSSNVNWGGVQKCVDAVRKPNGPTSYNSTGIDQFKIMSYAEVASFLGISKATLERLVADKRGPPVVPISERRRGFRVGDVIEWINTRVQHPDAK